MADVSLAADGLPIVKFVAAFVFVMAAMFGLGWILKRTGLAGPIIPTGQKRRLKVLEVLNVDHRRKLVLIRRDDSEHLLLLGPEHSTIVETSIPARADHSPASVSLSSAEEAVRRDHA